MESLVIVALASTLVGFLASVFAQLLMRRVFPGLPPFVALLTVGTMIPKAQEFAPLFVAVVFGFIGWFIYYLFRSRIIDNPLFKR